jgi:hypothetical protein
MRRPISLLFLFLVVLLTSSISKAASTSSQSTVLRAQTQQTTGAIRSELREVVRPHASAKQDERVIEPPPNDAH